MYSAYGLYFPQELGYKLIIKPGKESRVSVERKIKVYVRIPGESTCGPQMINALIILQRIFKS